ncbi:MAG TPA: hypothetical protein VF538_16300 [Pyrinomonadaceae bacterium]
MESLSPDAEEAGRRYTRLHKKLVGFFHLRGIADTGRAADETIDRAAVKISAGAPVPDVDKYCMGVARNVAMERWRGEQREGASFLHFVERLADNCDEEVDRINRILQPCFEQLAADERELLMAYCQRMQGRARAEHRRRLAEEMKTTVLALRMRVTRLRGVLTDCVRKRTHEGPASI